MTLLSLSDWNLVALCLRRDKIKAEELKDVRILSNKKGNKVEYSTFVSWGKEAVIGHEKVESQGKTNVVKVR